MTNLDGRHVFEEKCKELDKTYVNARGKARVTFNRTFNRPSCCCHGDGDPGRGGEERRVEGRRGEGRRGEERGGEESGGEERGGEGRGGEGRSLGLW